MASEYYVDENGNIVKVSGTINNAKMLPIESGSATNTKDYIDTGLSGKADTISDSGWLDMSLSSGVSNITDKKSQYRTIGNVLYFNIQAEFTNAPSWGTNIGWLGRCKYESTFSGRYGNGICTITISDAGNVVFLATTNTSSTDKRLIISGSYIFES